VVNDDRPPDVALEHGGDPPASHRRELDRLAVGVNVSPFVIRETHAEQRVAEELRHQRRLVQSPKELEVTPGGAMSHAMVLASIFSSYLAPR